MNYQKFFHQGYLKMISKYDDGSLSAAGDRRWQLSQFNQEKFG